MNKGINIDEIYHDLLQANNLKYISRTGNYYFDNKMQEQLYRECMSSNERKEINKELYPLFYAYEKYKENCKRTENKNIKNKIKEMKIR